MTVQPGSRIEAKALLRAVPPAVRPRAVPRQYAPPRFPPDLVGLDRVGPWLDQLERHELGIVRAPAGYGKTAFCAALFAEARDAGWDAGWVSFEADGDDGAATDHLVQAVRLARGDAGRNAAPELASAAEVADALADHIDADDRPLLLILDDVDRLRDAHALDVLNRLLRHPPVHLRLVMASRAIPALATDAAERRGMALRIGRADLALTDDMLREVLRGAGVTLDEPRRTALQDFLDGWPAGARIAARQAGGLARDDDWSALTDRIASYLATIIGDMSEADRRFLRRAAVAPKLNADLGRLLSGEADSEDLLGALAARGLFIEAPTDGSGWYHLHPAFRAVLLFGVDRDSLSQLFRVSARHYAAQGMKSDAVGQALAGGDAALAAEWLGDIAMALLEAGATGRVAGWMARLEPEHRAASPRLVIADAWLSALTARNDAAVAIAALAAQGGEAEAAAIDLFHRAYAGDRLDAVAEACDQRLAAPGDLSDFAVAMLRAMHAHGASRRGLFGLVHDAVRPLMQRRAGRSLDLPLALGVCARAAASRALGQLGEAERVLRDARRTATETNLATALVDAALARCCYERADPAAAAELANAALPLLEQSVFQDALINAFLVAIRVAASLGRADQAAALVDRAELLAFDRGWAPLKALCIVERARLRLPQTIDPEAVVAVVDEDAAVVDPLSAPGRAFALLSEARAYDAIAQGDRPRLTTVAERLLRLASNADDAELRASATLFNILPQLSGRCDKMVELETVRFLNHAASVGFRRTIVDVLDVTGVRAVQNFCSEAYSSDCFLALLKLADPARHDPALEGANLPAPGEAFSFLTEREIEILSALNAGESNKEIARTLQLAPETVKWHLKNVMRKLRATSREEAVLNATTLGLKLIETAAPR
ncbi:MAG: LuxR C-terminal-related transcriptional regulator [Sphingopyxis sp.]|uniref:helix-turn-helix transcriptional regulator n=1 Tax=Sphingopyxis sp. TaxID=1908224 RepID=UPI003D6C983E